MAVYDTLEKQPNYAAWKASEECKGYADLNRQMFNF